MLGSMVCKYSDFSLPWYRPQERSLMLRQIYSYHSAAQQDFVNRKFWEWCVIAQALEDRCKLKTGTRALGFAVGTEPLTAHFAGRGCTVLATDLDVNMSDQGWVDTGQHAASLDALYQPLLVNRELFNERVSFQPADMRTLEGLSGEFDFIWSSCALEHLGTLQAGIEFVVNSAKMLSPGGVAVHTTEFNVSSNDRTIETGSNVVYRRQDIAALAKVLKENGFVLAAPDFDCGEHQYDKEFDRPPYMTTERRHLKLLIGEYVSTSMLLVIERTRSRWG